MTLLDVLQDRQAGDPRHHVIEQHDVIVRVIELGQTVPAILGSVHGVPGTFQTNLQQAPEGRIVSTTRKCLLIIRVTITTISYLATDHGMFIHRELSIHWRVGYLFFGSPACRLLSDGVGFRRGGPCAGAC